MSRWLRHATKPRIEWFSSARGPVELVVVEDLGAGILAVCKLDGYERSRMDERYPRVVGFKKADIIRRHNQKD